MRETEQGEVTMEGVDYNIMEAIVHYLYGATVSVKWDKVQQFIEACEMLQLQLQS